MGRFLGMKAICATLALVFGSTPAAGQQVSLESDERFYVAGDTATVSWSAVWAEECSVDAGDWQGPVPVAGSEELVVPLAGRTVLLTCGTRTRISTASLTLESESDELEADFTFRNDFESIRPGDYYVHSWSVPNAERCLVNGAISTNFGFVEDNPSTLGEYRTLIQCEKGLDMIETELVTVVELGEPDPMNVPGFVALVASRSRAFSGEPITLRWDSTAGNTGCGAGGGWSGRRASAGVQQIPAPQGPTPFSLNCGGRSVAVQLSGVELTPEAALAAEPRRPVIGANYTLDWQSSGARICVGTWAGQVGLQGSAAVTANQAKTFDRLECASGDGTARISFELEALETAPEDPQPVIEASAEAVERGQSIIANWGGLGIDECSTFGDWDVAIGPTGMATITPVRTGLHEFGISCAGDGGRETSSIELNVTVGEQGVPDPATDTRPAEVLLRSILEFGAVPDVIEAGEVTSLRWETTELDSCVGELDWEEAELPATGSMDVMPTGNPGTTAQYALICSGGDVEVVFLEQVAIIAGPEVVPAPEFQEPLGAGSLSLRWLLGLLAMSFLQARGRCRQ